jgi:hypothetical protein
LKINHDVKYFHSFRKLIKSKIFPKHFRQIRGYQQVMNNLSRKTKLVKTSFLGDFLTE